MASSFSSTLQGRNMLPPHSTVVYLPSTGDKHSNVKADLGNPKRSSQFNKAKTTHEANPGNRKYLEMINPNLTFSCDVIEDRCLYMMPYNEKYFAGIFEPGELISVPKRANTFHGSIKRSAERRCTHHHLKPISKPKCISFLESSNKTKAHKQQKGTLLANKDKKRAQSSGDLNPSDSSATFLTEINSSDSYAAELTPLLKREPKVQRSNRTSSRETKPLSSTLRELQSTQNKLPLITDNKEESMAKKNCVPDASKEEQSEAKTSDWDDHLLSQVSQLTANWIVHECTPENKQREKLSSKLQSWYGHTAHTDLLGEEERDESSEKQEKVRKKWKKAEAILLARVYDMTPPPATTVDPYSSDSQAPFHRQPAGIGKLRTVYDQETVVNSTAHNITVPEHVKVPQPKLKSLLNPRIGDKIYETDNPYQQEWLTGKRHVFNINGDPSEILMETENKYRKQLQQEMPLEQDVWYVAESDKSKEQLSPKKTAFHKPKRGIKRWTALPQPVLETDHLLTEAPTEFDSSIQKNTEPKHLQAARQNHALVSIVRDWLNKWFMCGQFADSNPDDLIRDMADIQPHVRLKAICTIAKAAECKPTLPKNILDSTGDSLFGLPEKIFVALECFLEDSHSQVRKAAAVTLYTLERPNDKAQRILQEMLVSESEFVRWTGAHCLAHFGECDSDVVAEVIKQILSTESVVKYQQGVDLLVKISANGNIVHCMVAEQLNSTIWKHRAIACKILSTLFGRINKDITQKLSNLMWHDWHVEVRTAAAQCLGRMGHGQDVHDTIKEKLLHGTEKTKLEAISKLGQLGIMTAKLLPPFLQCFSNPYVLLRCEVCITCASLMIKDSQVIDQLVHLATFDQSWKVKALAIQALGKIGEVSAEIKECLLWAVRFEEQPGVRAEACHSLMELDIQGDDVIDMLQERLLVESSQIVREEVAEALSLWGFSSTEDPEMVARVKSEVRKLSHQNIISSQILVNEMVHNKQKQLAGVCDLTEEDIKALKNQKAMLLKDIRSQAKITDSHSSTDKAKAPLSSPRLKVTARCTTPEPLSREGTDFTLVADKELEALLSQDKSETGSVSSRSAPLTRQSLCSVEGNDVQETWQGETNQHSIIIHPANDDGDESPSHFNSRGITDIESEGEKRKSSENLSRYLSLPRLQTSVSSQDGSVSPSVIVDDQKGSPLSPGQFYSHRSKVKKEQMEELKKFNRNVIAVYEKLDARYIDLGRDLMRIDQGYNISGFSAGSVVDGGEDVLSVDEIWFAKSNITDNLLQNVETDIGVAAPVSLGTEMGEALQRHGGHLTLKDSTDYLKIDNNETSQRDSKMATTKDSTVNVEICNKETSQRDGEVATTKDSTINVEICNKETSQRDGEVATTKDSAVEIETDNQQNSQRNGETLSEMVENGTLNPEMQHAAPKNRKNKTAKVSFFGSETEVKEI